MRRTAKKDAELNGAEIKAGDKVVMYFGSANRDPAHFDQPDALDLARPIESHLAFGGRPARLPRPAHRPHRDRRHVRARC